ncbi:MAG: hypothetical protein ACXACD_12875, partial [Candidatus Thorarchaeota archaeon]
GQEVNITIFIIDELGSPIENLAIVVSLDDPLGVPVRLGVWSNSIAVTTTNGVAVVTFEPTMSGLYFVHLSSSGATSIHGFTDDTFHTVYTESSIDIGVSETELEAGDMLDITVLLTDYQGSPMAGRNITVVLDGPGDSTLGPVLVLTDGTGYAFWSVQMEDEGLWIVTAAFDGLGVYLATTGTVEVSVRYATEIQASVISAGAAVAGLNPASISVLLMDSGGTPLEGFTIDYSAYHDLLGLTLTDSAVQTGQEPIILNVTLDRMGNYTILLSFSGTTHYHASNAALRIWVHGTTSLRVSVSYSVERSSESYLNVSVLDEVGSIIALSEIDIFLEMFGPVGLVDISSRLRSSTNEIRISLQGLDVGPYTVNLTIADGLLRVGVIDIIQFDVVAATSFAILEENLSGLVDQDHHLTFTLVDSMEDVATGAIVYVSLHSPDGREIHGSPLTTRTAHTITSNGIAISWDPSLTGNYTLTLVFEGTGYWQATSHEIDIPIRYPSHLDIEHPAVMEFGQPVPLSVTASYGVFKIPDASLTVRVWREGDMMFEQTAITSSRGIAEVVLEGLLAGNLSIEVKFGGAGSFAPTTQSISMMVIPVLVVDAIPLTQVLIGLNCTLNVSYIVLGVSNDWKGGLEISVENPADLTVGTWVLVANRIGFAQIEFHVEIQGLYRVDVTITNLPGVEQMSTELAFDTTSVTSSIPMDASIPPWIGGLGIVAAATVLVWKRIVAIIGKLPGEWET